MKIVIATLGFLLCSSAIAQVPEPQTVRGQTGQEVFHRPAPLPPSFESTDIASQAENHIEPFAAHAPAQETVDGAGHQTELNRLFTSRYASFFGGMVMPDVLAEPDMGWAIGGALGRRIHQHWRLESEFAYRCNTDDNLTQDLTARYTSIATLGKDPTNVDARFDDVSILGNVVFDFNPEGRLFRPYLGAGIGGSFVRGDLTSIPHLTLDGREITRSSSVDEFVMAYQVFGGTGIQLSQRAELYFEYRFHETGDFSVINQRGQSVGEDNLIAHQLLWGIRCRFGPQTGSRYFAETD